MHSSTVIRGKELEDYGLSGKVALVAGGGSRDEGIGNGRAAAILLARSGAKVAVMDQQLDAAQKTVEMIEEEGNTAAAFTCDATDETDCKALIDTVMQTYGRLDCLDNNIGIGSIYFGLYFCQIIFDVP